MGRPVVVQVLRGGTPLALDVTVGQRPGRRAMSPVLEARAGLRAFIGLAPGILERVRPSIVRVRGQGPTGAAGVAWGRRPS